MLAALLLIRPLATLLLNNFTVCGASIVLPPNMLLVLDVVADSDEVLLNVDPPKIFVVTVACGETASLKATDSFTWLLLSIAFGREVFFCPSKSFDVGGAAKTFLAADGWL